MRKVFCSETLTNTWRTVRPWGIIIALFLLLRYTGLLAGISYLTGSAILKSGIMDIQPEAPLIAKKFDYNFSIRDLNGKIVDVNEFKGKTIFLNIWATWCGPCRVEMPSIQSLYSQMDPDKIMFVMLSVDRQEDFEKVKNFVSDKNYTFPVYTPSGALPGQLQVRSIPTTFVVNPDGKIVSHETGAANYDTPAFKQYLETLLKP